MSFIIDVWISSVVTTMENEWDVMPSGRQKINHGVGAVCKFTLDIKNSPYTGLLKNGKTTGLIRVSLARSTNIDTYLPSASLKFLRSGTSSANAVFLGFVDIFRLNVTNNIFDPDIQPLFNQLLTLSKSPKLNDDKSTTQIIKKLKQADDCPALVGLSDLTRYV